MTIVGLEELSADIDGASTLDQLLDVFRKYVVFPSEDAAYAVVLWVAATHAQKVWPCATRLVVNSPEKRCGKTRLLDLLGLSVRHPLMSSNISPAALYRSITRDDPPTLLLDEADAIFSPKKSNRENAEELRGTLNAGFTRDRQTIRCVGPNSTPTSFETFCMVCLAGIGDFAPDTITDRAVTITLRRRAGFEQIEPYRIRRDAQRVSQAAENVASWVESKLDWLADSEPDMPVEDREADTWESLVAIADAAEGDWPDRARAACLSLTQAARGEEVEQSSAIRLLEDIKAVFADWDPPAISSELLSNHLRGLDDSPWYMWDLNPSKLAHRLRTYGIKPKPLRTDSGKQVRGYRREWFEDAWSRYLPNITDEVASQDVTPSHDQVTPVTGQDFVTGAPVTDPEDVTSLTSTGDGVTPRDANPDSNTKYYGYHFAWHPDDGEE